VLYYAAHPDCLSGERHQSGVEEDGNRNWLDLWLDVKTPVATWLDIKMGRAFLASLRPQS